MNLTFFLWDLIIYTYFLMNKFYCDMIKMFSFCKKVNLHEFYISVIFQNAHF